MINCCTHTLSDNKCKRSDGKIYKLPRRYSRSKCLNSSVKGFTMKASCAPYKLCKRFLFNPENPKMSFDVYINKNPNDTISIKYKTYEDVKNTIMKLERYYKTKKYDHKRIVQVEMILMVRLRVLKGKKMKHYKLSEQYFEFLKLRTRMSENDRRRFDVKKYIKLI